MRALVVAKAPVPGRVKTRLGAQVGMEAAAGLAAAALLDTLAACRVGVRRVPSRARRRPGRRRRGRTPSDARSTAGPCTSSAATGSGSAWPTPMRTRQGQARPSRSGWTPRSSRPTTCMRSREAASTGDAVLGPAADGGWWVLALSDPTAAAALADVPMSRPDTFATTRSALTAAGTDRPGRARAHRRRHRRTRRRRVADSLTGGHFLRAWRVGGRMTTLPLASVYTHALQGHACTVWEGDLAPQPLPTHAWLAGAGAADRRPARALPGSDDRHRLWPRPDDRGPCAGRPRGARDRRRAGGGPADPLSRCPGPAPQRLRPASG